MIALSTFQTYYVPINEALLGPELGPLHALTWKTGGEWEWCQFSCACGWFYQASLSEIARRLAAGDPREPAMLAYERHLRDILALYNPTIADLTEWGWFDPDSW